MGLTVIVLTVDPKINEVIRRREIDFTRSRSREWLRNHMVWAFTNGYIVETFSEKIDKEFKLSEEYYLTAAKVSPR